MVPWRGKCNCPTEYAHIFLECMHFLHFFSTFPNHAHSGCIDVYRAYFWNITLIVPPRLVLRGSGALILFLEYDEFLDILGSFLTGDGILSYPPTE